MLSGVGSALTVTDGVSPVSDVSQITVAGDITLTDDTGGLVTISATDTTYTITTVDSGDDALIRLNDGSTNDDITIAAGSGITIDHTTDTITISAAAGTTINNNADNRVITGSGTANTLEGEANLTYNGQLLDIKNDGTDQSEIRLYCESSNAALCRYCWGSSCCSCCQPYTSAAFAARNGGSGLECRLCQW